MKITPKENKKTRKFQTGGTMPVEDPAVNNAPVESPEQGGQQDPIMMLAQMFAQGLQNQDCQLLAQGAQMFLEIVQQMQGGTPQEPQEEPVYRKGGTLVRKIKK